MKRWSAGLFAAVLVLLVLPGNQRPFDSLAPGSLAAASVRLIPPDTTVELDGEALETLASLLREIRLSCRDRQNAYARYAGQSVVFTLKKKDGSTAAVTVCTPFVLINGYSYYAAFEPCQALSAFASQLLT